MTNLRWLRLDKSNLSKVPEEICQLTKLVSMILFYIRNTWTNKFIRLICHIFITNILYLPNNLEVDIKLSF